MNEDNCEIIMTFPDEILQTYGKTVEKSKNEKTPPWMLWSKNERKMEDIHMPYSDRIAFMWMYREKGKVR